MNTNNNNLYETNQFIADPKQSAIRLDKFLTDRLFKVSRSKIQTAIKVGLVTVNELEVKANYKIRPGDVVEVSIPKVQEASAGLVPEDMPLDIVYEDGDLLIVHKPAGLVVHPGVGNYRHTLVHGLAYYFNNLPVMAGNPENRPGLVHRIDKDTSGLLVVAKTELAMFHLGKQFHDHKIHRRYQAIVWGEPDEESGTITSFIGRHPRFRTRMAVVEEEENGKWSCTHWKLLERLYYVSLLELQLETGRTHQIRVHMAHRGNPLFNDEKYGGARVVKGTVFSKYKQFVQNCFEAMPRHALHAKELGFVHPVTGKDMFFDSELPADMTACLERWRTYVTDRKSKLTLEQE